MGRTFLYCVAAIALSAAIAMAAMAASTPTADPEDQEQVAQGAKVYAVACASCHGENLEGEANWQQRKENGRLRAPPHDETGHTWHHPDKLLFDITKLGPAALVGQGYESDMQGFAETLTDEEIWSVLAFIKSQWPERIRARQAEINAQVESQ